VGPVAVNETVVLDAILLVALPAVVGYFLARWLGGAAKGRGWPPARVRTLRAVITIAWVAIATAGATATLGSFSFLSALTVSAIAGVAISLALQTTLQNILAGFILAQQRFLRTGDVIQVGGVKGTVVGIGLVDVILRTEAGPLAMVSTSNLLAGPTINFTATERLLGDY
jgi:small conductance mechanosensitive channel